MIKNNENYIILIQEIMAKNGWTQAELASQMEVTFATLNRWINAHSTPHTNHLKLIKQLHKEYVGLKKVDEVLLGRAVKQALKWQNPKYLQGLPKDIIKELVISATFNSNTIEGTKLSYKETRVLIEDLQMTAHKPYEDHLVSTNHAALTKDILGGEYKGPYSEVMIKDWHRRLFTGIRSDAGHYSRMHHLIHGSNLSLTHPEDIPEEMTTMIKALNHKILSSEKIFDHLARCHADFERIHPFGDGNGRIGRLLLMRQCFKLGLPPVIIRNERKIDYLESLENAQRHDESHFILFLIGEMKFTHEMIHGKNRKHQSIT